MTTKEKIEVMQAYEDGKQIECRQTIAKAIGDEEWEDSKEPTWDWVMFDYRIKPKHEYRPYKDTDEMIADWKERFNAKVWPSYSMPLIWLSWDGTLVFITGFKKSMVDVEGYTKTMHEIFDFFTYLDGSPCGKEVNNG